MRTSIWWTIVAFGFLALYCCPGHAGLVAQWLAEDLFFGDGGDLSEWPESLTGDPLLEFDGEHGHFRAEATPNGTSYAEFNGDGVDNNESVQTLDTSGSPVAGLTEFTVAVTFRPRAAGENPAANDFWQNTAVVDGDVRGIDLDWGTSWRGTDSFGGGVGQPPRDISVYAKVEGQDDLLDQWLTAVYTVSGAEQSHFALLVAEDGNFGVTPDDGSRDLGTTLDPRGDFGLAFAVQRANLGGRNLIGDIAEVRFYDQAFNDDGALTVAAEMHEFHVGATIIATRLQAGDANMDLKFDQVDLVQVQVAAKYLSGQAATWGEGDWNGAPGGSPGSPPTGNGLFDQLDIVAALSAGVYLTGPYAGLARNGTPGDGQTSIAYNPATGEVAVDSPANTELTSVNIDSAAGIFTGDAAQNLGGSFDNDADNNIFKATFGSSFGSLSFGNVAQTGLTEDFVLGDLTVIGSLAGGGALGDVDLIYVPEPTSIVLLVLGAAALAARGIAKAIV